MSIAAGILASKGIFVGNVPTKLTSSVLFSLNGLRSRNFAYEVRKLLTLSKAFFLKKSVK
jgi:hypothetical protein